MPDLFPDYQLRGAANLMHPHLDSFTKNKKRCVLAAQYAKNVFRIVATLGKKILYSTLNKRWFSNWQAKIIAQEKLVRLNLILFNRTELSLNEKKEVSILIQDIKKICYFFRKNGIRSTAKKIENLLNSSSKDYFHYHQRVFTENSLIIAFNGSSQVKKTLDFSKAFKRLSESAKNDKDYNSQILLSFCFKHGLGCEVNIERANEIYQKASKPFEGLEVTLGNVNDPLSYGRSFLAAACSENNEEYVRALLNLGADPNQPDYDGVTPFHLVCSYGDLNLARLFINHVKDIDHSCHLGKTALHFACNTGHLEIAELLLTRGAKINKADRFGNEPLFSACTSPKCNFKLIQFLLNNGANLIQKDGTSFDVYTKVHEKEKRSQFETVYNNSLQAKSVPHKQTHDKEAYLLKLLGHVFNLAGKISLGNNAKVEFTLEGFSLGRMSSHLAKVMAQYAAFTSKNDFETFNLAAQAFKLEYKDSELLFNQWQEGKPVILPFGYFGHYVGFLLWKNYIILCDRSGTFSHAADNLRFYTFNKDLLNREFIEKISYSPHCELSNYLELINEFPQLLECQELFFGEDLLGNQITGNCTLANRYGLILGFLILHELVSKGLEKEVVQSIIGKQKEKFENFRSFHQIMVLRKYLAHHKSIDAFFQHGFEILERIFAYYFPAQSINFDIQELWRQEEELFLRMLPEDRKPSYDQMKQHSATFATKGEFGFKFSDEDQSKNQKSYMEIANTILDILV